MIDAQRFVDFYASKGWMVGSAPMADWRSSVRMWYSRDQRYRSDASGGGLRSFRDCLPPLERAGREMDQLSARVKPRDPAIDQANALVAHYRSLSPADARPMEDEELERTLTMVRGMLRDAGMPVE